jgi:hypothetical protein
MLHRRRNLSPRKSSRAPSGFILSQQSPRSAVGFVASGF